MKGKILLAASTAAICLAAWAAKDPVVMTVNGVDVPRSEFEYLYRKNSQQNLGNQTVDQYAEMFKVYKLKVADALAAGIDTTAAFRNEFRGYRNELSSPYMIDSVYLDKLMREAFDRSREEVETSHIMLFKRPNSFQNREVRERLDSIRQAVMAGADFAEMAKKYSQDRSSASKGGSLGFIPALYYPYDFETAAFTQKPGSVSEIVESAQAYHIIKTGAHRPSRGKVLAEHIMKMVRLGSPDSLQQVKKAQIDSLYSVITDTNFEDLATRYSDDKGSARNGGKLPLFGTGQMVPEFEEVAFSLKPGEISKPFRSQFGWHIVKKLESKAPESYDEMKDFIRRRVTAAGDPRSAMLARHQADIFNKQYKGRRHPKAISAMRASIGAAGFDSVFNAKYDTPAADAIVLYSIGDRKVSARDLARSLRGARVDELGAAIERFDTEVNSLADAAAMEYGRDHLGDVYPEYRNLLKEYRDGMLLFEISNREVWDKASKDTEGLKRYFATHKEEYKWKKPHHKAWIIQATNDSVAEAVKARLPQLAADTLVRTIRAEFPKTVQIDRILMEEGKNAAIDSVMSGKTDVTPPNPKFTLMFAYKGVTLTKPEEVGDVRGLVTSDYQNQLEKEWIDRLKARYPVSVNSKELKKIK